MHAHLHVLLPSSTPGVRLEARVYVPPDAAGGALAPQLSMDADSEPIPLASLDVAALRSLRLDTVVTAAHPWSRLGGNMLFPALCVQLPPSPVPTSLNELRAFASAPSPLGFTDASVIAHHLPLAVYDAGVRAAIATFNVRGVGRSEGSQPWPGWGIGSDGDDFAAVEGAVLGLIRGDKGTAADRADAGDDDIALFRLGYSYGTLLAVNAPPRPGVRRTMLVAPAPTLFRAMTVMRGPTFQEGYNRLVARAAEAQGVHADPHAVWLVYGTKDDFTSAATLRSLVSGSEAHVRAVEIEGCGHFFVRAEDGRALRAAIADWVRGR